MSEPKFKPGQFISTAEGRMRVKGPSAAPCQKCILALKDNDDNIIIWHCHSLYGKYKEKSCCDLIGENCYLEKV